MTEETRIHEAGHAVVWTLEEEHLGPLAIVSALPNGRAEGHVRGAEVPAWPPAPRMIRARARVLMAGLMAQKLAGFEVRGFESDASHFAGMWLYMKDSERPIKEAIAGAEFMLRCNWGAVEGVAELLGQLGELTPPSGIELVRMELRKPSRPLVPDIETLVRLADSVENVPELREQFEAGLRQVASAA
jgi:hypothetical protein